MKILYILSVISVAVLALAALAIARHIRKSTARAAPELGETPSGLPTSQANADKA